MNGNLGPDYLEPIILLHKITWRKWIWNIIWESSMNFN